MSDSLGSAEVKLAKESDHKSKASTSVDLQKVKMVALSQIKPIFSRCGVAISDITISDPIAFSASVFYNLNWTFKCRCSDKVLTSVSDETHVLTTVGLDEYTQANTKELENENSTKTKIFVDKLNKSSFKELFELSGQIVCFNRLSAIGRTKCKSCHGSNKVVCDICEGKGVVPCPACHGKGGNCQVCHGKGFVKCAHCSGSGHIKCKDCKGKGEQIVEREIIYDASCKKEISIKLEVPGSKTNYRLSEQDEKVILNAASFDSANNGHEVPRGYVATFNGKAPCYVMHVLVNGFNEPFDFILCGEELKAICKPPVIDYLFSQEASLLSETLITSAQDVEEKVKCVKALASKAILAKTIRAIESHELEIVNKEAVRNGVTVESILNSKKSENPKGFAIKSVVNVKLLESITNELKENAHGYVSDEFARKVSHDLILFVPMLMELNPNTKFIWSVVSLLTWLGAILFLYLIGRPLGIFLVGMLATIVCVFTSFVLTKNWAYYSVVSMLKLTHKMKKVPNVTIEAVESGKLLGGVVLISVIAFILMRVF